VRGHDTLLSLQDECWGPRHLLDLLISGGDPTTSHRVGSALGPIAVHRHARAPDAAAGRDRLTFRAPPPLSFPDGEVLAGKQVDY